MGHHVCPTWNFDRVLKQIKKRKKGVPFWLAFLAEGSGSGRRRMTLGGLRLGVGVGDTARNKAPAIRVGVLKA